MGDGDKRLIEDYLPIEAISSEARIENSVTQARGYLSKALLSILHRWWARRPLVACRAAIYGALVPWDQHRPSTGPESLARANAAKFVGRLARREVTREDLATAARQIRDANGGRPPRVLDPFAGGGSIPLEASRLGCESYALELNPVAHIVQLATLAYPATFGQQLVDEVKRAAGEVYRRAKAEVGDLYPLLPDPRAQTRSGGRRQSSFAGVPSPRPADADGWLTPVAYLWTRTVPCRRCGGAVPLHRQTWLRRKEGGYVALRPVPDAERKTVTYTVLESASKSEKQAVTSWSFDPTDLSSGGETACPFCQTAVPTEHIKQSGKSGEIRVQLIAVVSARHGERGKVYLPVDDRSRMDDVALRRQLDGVLTETGLTLPTEPIFCGDSRAFFSHLYGLMTFADHFTTRQLLVLFTFIKHLHAVHAELLASGAEPEFARAVSTYVAFVIDKVAERGANACRWDGTRETIASPIANGKMPMVWDFPEANPFSGGSGSWTQSSSDVIGALEALATAGYAPCGVRRGSALAMPFDDGHFDAVITDPPYYDNVPYAYLADFFFVWLKRSIGHLYPEHFAGATSPTKAEAVMDPSRHDGKKEKAKAAYEAMMAQAFSEASRVLRPGGAMVCVYAHKTTAGWATLVDALRRSGFAVTEAWPMDTENPSRQRSKESAALASSIFLVSRKRDGTLLGNYETEVRPELEEIVRERVGTLWDQGVSGADLVIACVGAGLRAFTRFARVEYANGEEVPAARFLGEVETAVLETILGRLSKEVGGNGRTSLAGVDPATRFYVLWRYTYGNADLDAGEAIVFANGTHVELEGPTGLSAGSRALIQKRKSQYRLRDYAERGEDDKLGMPSSEGLSAPLVDILHRTLWLMEHRPHALAEFLRDARPNRDQMRLVAQALSGPALKGGEVGDVSPTAELSALGKLTANWRSVVEDAVVPARDREAKRAGQATLFDDGDRR